MGKRIISFLVITFILFSFLALDINADMGPKSTIDIEIIGVDQPYYFDVLIYESNDIEILDLFDLANEIEGNYYQDDYPSDILNGYQDEDGFVSRTLYNGIPAILSKPDDSKEIYHVGYFSAPKTFKIVIILDDDTMITSKIIDRKLFQSTMTYDLSDVDLSFNQQDVGVLTESIPYTHVSISLLIRVIITVGVELLILFAYNYRRKESYMIVGLTNLVTQTLLTVFMAIGFYAWGSFFGLLGVLILGEILVFITEILLYGYVLKEHSRSKAMGYAFIANVITLILTFLTIGFI
ncbi:hypothetical protein [Mariniplasma anaerobium]|uniref:Uncharacterized protein n=1 Tax=Mariniplasma anaerobium TaxID=2735436 RepID=A0A7U9TL99_9MOLU|nr:hypothetical protein [Mariniplasma anaerobium]BCR36187.1 hypothetical protein MPAN_010800 [Mariniplasma anaerobium]